MTHAIEATPPTDPVRTAFILILNKLIRSALSASVLAHLSVRYHPRYNPRSTIATHNPQHPQCQNIDHTNCRKRPCHITGAIAIAAVMTIYLGGGPVVLSSILLATRRPQNYWHANTQLSCKHTHTHTQVFM